MGWGLFLQPDMGVIPVGSILSNRKLVEDRVARFDGCLRDVRYAVLEIGYEHAVPVDGRRFHQSVVDENPEIVPFPESQLGTGQQIIGENGRVGIATLRLKWIHGLVVDVEHIVGFDLTWRARLAGPWDLFDLHASSQCGGA